MVGVRHDECVFRLCDELEGRGTMCEIRGGRSIRVVDLAVLRWV
jgi:hypothetical protein